MSIPIKSEKDMVKMRIACETASEILALIRDFVVPGRTTLEVDHYARDLMAERECRSAFLGYVVNKVPFPGHICISLNEEVVHGIGGPRRIQPGDIVKVDVGIIKGGWVGDNATTIAAGPISPEAIRLLKVTEEALFKGIEQARSGVPLKELCGAIEGHVRRNGMSVVREFVGHGVGRKLHEEPQVPNYVASGPNPRLKPGMVLAIEPMVNAGSASVQVQKDKWTVVTKDSRLSAHFEHSVLVTRGEPEILTLRSAAVPKLAAVG
jgi:methionyl aminopeptidase